MGEKGVGSTLALLFAETYPELEKIIVSQTKDSETSSEWHGGGGWNGPYYTPFHP